LKGVLIGAYSASTISARAEYVPSVDPITSEDREAEATMPKVLRDANDADEDSSG
jgi:hypothetical protein